MNNKAFFLIPLILTIGIIPFIPNSLAQVVNQNDLEECRDGLIIVYLINGNTFTCKEPSTAERWQELGIATIVDPNYVPTVVEEEPEKLSIFQRLAIFNQENSTVPSAVEIPEEIIEPNIETFDEAVVQTASTTAQTVLETTPKPSNPPEDAGKPEFAGKPEGQGSPDNTGKPDLPGTPTNRGGLHAGVKASGYVVIEVFDDKGNKKFHREDHNLVVDSGLEALSDLAFGTTHVSGESAGAFVNISVGSSGTAPAAGQTDCLTQNGNKKADASVTNTALGAVINVSWIAELPAVSLQEICLTDSITNSTGNLFSRQTFTAIPLTTTDTVNAQWTITFADSNGT